VKVTIVRGGGFGGISTRTELDDDGLPDDDARRTFADLVGRAKARAKSPAPAGRPAPDQTLYEVHLDDGDEKVQARFDDQNIPDEVRHLVEWVDARPERKHRIER
jgi:hypothetical protein